MALLDILQEGHTPMILGGADIEPLAGEVKSHALTGERLVAVSEVVVESLVKVDLLPYPDD